MNFFQILQLDVAFILIDIIMRVEYISQLSKPFINKIRFPVAQCHHGQHFWSLCLDCFRYAFVCHYDHLTEWVFAPSLRMKREGAAGHRGFKGGVNHPFGVGCFSCPRMSVPAIALAISSSESTDDSFYTSKNRFQWNHIYQTVSLIPLPLRGMGGRLLYLSFLCPYPFWKMRQYSCFIGIRNGFDCS